MLYTNTRICYILIRVYTRMCYILIRATTLDNAYMLYNNTRIYAYMLYKIGVYSRIHTFCLHKQVTAFDVKLLPAYSHKSVMGTHDFCIHINHNNSEKINYYLAQINASYDYI
jgi:hypothetical protein